MRSRTCPGGQLTPHVQETESQVASLRGHGFANHLIAHLLLLNGVVPDNILYEAQMMFLAPAWSLSLEWQFYLVAPLVIAAMRNSGGRIAAAAVAGIAFIAYAKGAFGQFDHPSFLPGSAVYFAVGIITRLAFDRLPTVARYPTTLLILLLCATFNIEHLRPLVLWGAFVAWWLLEQPAGQSEKKVSRYAKLLFENDIVRGLASGRSPPISCTSRSSS
jgi:peptidoglycan/LPS O-acetylase OafA/YrhL